jgi:hypothetical protein
MKTKPRAVAKEFGLQKGNEDQILGQQCPKKELIMVSSTPK